MSEYILQTSMGDYEYPSHMKWHSDPFFGSNFFKKWIPNWKNRLGHLINKDGVVGIEIGCLHGDCTVWCADTLVSGPGSVHYAIDVNDNEILQNNIKPYPQVKFIQGLSFDVLRTLTHNGMTKEFADYIYIDGSHLAINVMQDAVLSWYLLKVGGILIFDDYGWGVHTNDESQKPKLAVDSFLSTFRNHYELIEGGWQVFIKKISHVYTKEELGANYMDGELPK
jgi:cephalosporin hydroxylase